MARLNNYSTPSPIFWNFVGLAVFIMSIGVSWSLIRASTYKLETAHNRLEVNTAVDRVKKVSEDITQQVETLPIPQPQKRQLQKELLEADNELTQINQKILIDDALVPNADI